MTEKESPKIILSPLEPSDHEQFIKDLQESFKYGATEEFGMRDNHFDKEGQIIPRKDVERAIKSGKSIIYRIILDNKKVGGIIFDIKKDKKTGELEFLFISPKEHSKGIGTKTWFMIEEMYPEIELWITHTPYFEKRNIHFYMNRLGFHAVEFYNEKHKLHFEKENSEEENQNEEENEEEEEEFFKGPEEFFKFEKRMKK